MADDKDKKIDEVPHLEELTGEEKIPVSADGEPRYIEVQQIVEKGGGISGFELVNIEVPYPPFKKPCANLRNSDSRATGEYSVAEGGQTMAIGNCSHSFGLGTQAKGDRSITQGFYTVANNNEEVALGNINISEKQTTTFGDSKNTLFSLGNGLRMANGDKAHNAFQIMQSGDIYIPDTEAEGQYYEKPMLHLQEELKKSEIAMGWRRVSSPMIRVTDDATGEFVDLALNRSEISTKLLETLPMQSFFYQFGFGGFESYSFGLSKSSNLNINQEVVNAGDVYLTYMEEKNYINICIVNPVGYTGTIIGHIDNPQILESFVSKNVTLSKI